MTESERPRDPTVRNDFSGTAEGNIVQASSIGQVHFHTTSAYPVPSQLPPPPGFFTSRGTELADLRRWLAEDADTPLVAVISGPGGVGKTTLALQWLHDVRQHFPDGQLYIDLGAFSAGGTVPPDEALEWFLLALGLAPERIPPGLPQREALYRSLTADRLIAVLLDNALSAAQVRPLLPASSRSVVVVTSRSRLAGLRMGGARFIEVDPMDVADSVELLNRVVGDDRPVREPQQAEELATLCGGMPIALSMIGARLLAHPNRPLSREVGDLRGGNRLATMSYGDDPSVEAVFDMSYKELPERAARVYRRCALHPGESFGPDVVAAAADLSTEDTESALDVLVEQHLLTEIADRRFRYHDLLRLHARQQVEQAEPSILDATVRVMVEWYLDAVVTADLVLRPTRRRVGPRYHTGWRRPIAFDGHDAALRWLESERGNVQRSAHVADTHGWSDLVWEFCEALWGFYLHTRHYGDWLELHRIGIPAAQRCGNRVAEARLRIQRGTALANLYRYDEARQDIELALALAEQDRDQFTVATALSELAWVVQGEGDLADALNYLYRAKSIREVIGTARAVALGRRRIGEVLVVLGRFDEAVVELSEAATALAGLDDPAQQARALTSLGSAYTSWGRPQEAFAPLSTALDLTRRLGSPRYLAEVLAALGDAAVGTTSPDDARRYYAEAYDIYAASGDPKAVHIGDRLAAVR